MDTFNKVFKIQCVLLIVTWLLAEAHFHYIDYPNEILRRDARLRPVREIIPTPESENSSTDASIHTTNNETNESKKKSSIETYKNPTAGMAPSSCIVFVQNSSLDLQTENPVSQSIDQNNNITSSDVGCGLVELASLVNMSSENDTPTSSAKVSTLKPEVDLESTQVNIDSTSETSSMSSVSTNTENNLLGVFSPESLTLNPDDAILLPEVTTPKLEVVSEVTLENDGSTTETSVLSVPTSNPNTENDTSLLGVSKSGSENTLSVTQTNISSTNETPIISVSTSNPSTDEVTGLPEVNTPKPEVDPEVTSTNVDLSSVTSSVSSVSTNTEDALLGLGRPEPRGNINETEVNIYSTNQTTVSPTSTSNPSTDETTLLPEVSTLEPEVDPEVTNPSTDETTLLPEVSTLEPEVDSEVTNPSTDETTLLPEVSTLEPEIDAEVDSTYETSSNSNVTGTTSISTPYLNTETTVTTTSIVIPPTNPCHITKITKRNRTKIDNTFSGSSTNLNITTVVDTNPKTNQSSKTENSANSKARDECLSTVRTSLIDSVSKVSIDVFKQLLQKFLNAFDETFNQIFKPSVFSLRNEIASFLKNIRTDVDNDVDMAVNLTLANVLQIKSQAFDVIKDSEQRLIFNSVRVANLSLNLNLSISVFFEEIESLLSEFRPVEHFHSSSMNEALNNISALVEHTANKFLHDVDEVAVNEMSSSYFVKNSSLDTTRLVDEFLSKQGSKYEKFINDSEPFLKLIDDLREITVRYKNTFERNMDYLLVDSLIGVNDEKGLFDKLINDILFVLKSLRKNLLEARINRAKGSAFANIDLSKLSNIEIIRTQILEKHPQLEKKQLISYLNLIKNSVNDSIQAVQLLFNNLEGISESTNNGSVNGAFSLIQSSLYNTLCKLQKEVPPKLDSHFSNNSISFNITVVNSTYHKILRNHFEQLYKCESAEGDFSVSRGIFTYPFEYLLVFTILVHNLVMW